MPRSSGCSSLVQFSGKNSTLTFFRCVVLLLWLCHTSVHKQQGFSTFCTHSNTFIVINDLLLLAYFIGSTPKFLKHCGLTNFIRVRGSSFSLLSLLTHNDTVYFTSHHDSCLLLNATVELGSQFKKKRPVSSALNTSLGAD